MADILAEICDHKRTHVAVQKTHHTLSDLEAQAKLVSPPRGFYSALMRSAEAGRYGLIAEIKKASPSKGLIRADFDPVSLAGAYERAGASCLSVLTDQPYFQGADAYLAKARDAVTLPCLRKDFIVDPYQIAEARALGADAILLIMAALDKALALELEAEAMRYGMDVLVEVHNREELQEALMLKSPLIGINNRNLKTMDVSIETTLSMAPDVAADRLCVAESGLGTPQDLERCWQAGCRAFLIGESFMRQQDVEQAVRDLISKGPIQ